MTDNEIARALSREKTYVCVDDHKVIGIALFSINKKYLNLEFIYSIKPRCGIGKALMLKIAEYALKNNFILIKSKVSIIDKSAPAFYKSLGFSGRKIINSFLCEIYATPKTIISKSKKL